MGIQLNSKILEWKNLDLLQVTELKVSDAYLTVDSSKTNEEDDDMKISEK